MTVSERTQQAAEAIIARYPQPRSALLPLFYLVQAEHGEITLDGLAWCAEMVGVTKAEAQSVQSYYEMYEYEDPGDWLITVCRNFSCKVRGAYEILHRLEELTDGGHDREHGVAIKEMECLGNCEGAPVVQVNYNNYERCTLDRAEELLDACRRGDPPPSVSGEKPAPFREVSWRLAGAADHEVLHAGAVRGVEADMTARDEPPAERILEEDKDLGAPGVHQPGTVVGEPGDVDAMLPRERADEPAVEEGGVASDRADEGRAEDAEPTMPRTGEPEAPPSEEQPISDRSASPGSGDERGGDAVDEDRDGDTDGDDRAGDTGDERGA